jgi:hypothetical protein
MKCVCPPQLWKIQCRHRSSNKSLVSGSSPGPAGPLPPLGLSFAPRRFRHPPHHPIVQEAPPRRHPASHKHHQHATPTREAPPQCHSAVALPHHGELAHHDANSPHMQALLRCHPQPPAMPVAPTRRVPAPTVTQSQYASTASTTPPPPSQRASTGLGNSLFLVLYTTDHLPNIIECLIE